MFSLHTSVAGLAGQTTLIVVPAPTLLCTSIWPASQVDQKESEDV